MDAKNIGLQGQSWGGYQVAYLVTKTGMFKAAWAGAPVVNMFSAYGGIRWESGNNRQVQYEKGQSRIGATPWEKPELYIENSPFFHLKNDLITGSVLLCWAKAYPRQMREATNKEIIFFMVELLNSVRRG